MEPHRTQVFVNYISAIFIMFKQTFQICIGDTFL